MKCKNCGINEGLKYSKYASGDFCSRKCSHSFSTKNEINKTKLVNCEICNKEIEVNKRTSVYLCEECKENNKYKKNSRPFKKGLKKKVNGTCNICGKKINLNKKYCDECIISNNRKKLKENNYNYKYVLNWRNNNKRLAVEFLGGKCVICGYNKCLRNLDFHHINPSEKEITISHKINKIKFEKLKTELEKCILVCSNCHGEIHDGLIDLSVCLKG